MTDAQLAEELWERIRGMLDECAAASSATVLGEIREAMADVGPALLADERPDELRVGRAKDWAIRGTACFLALAARLMLADDVLTTEGRGDT